MAKKLWIVNLAGNEHAKQTKAGHLGRMKPLASKGIVEGLRQHNILGSSPHLIGSLNLQESLQILQQILLGPLDRHPQICGTVLGNFVQDLIEGSLLGACSLCGTASRCKFVMWPVVEQLDVVVTLCMELSECTKNMWDKPFVVMFQAKVEANQLKTVLTIRNKGKKDDAFDFQAGLHSCFKVLSFDKVEIAGSFWSKESRHSQLECLQSKIHETHVFV